MAKISGGVRIGGFVSPSDSLDTYPTHKSEYGFGGHREVIDLTSRDAITNDRRSEGMTVWVISENKEYRLIGGIANSNYPPYVKQAIDDLYENVPNLMTAMKYISKIPYGCVITIK